MDPKYEPIRAYVSAQPGLQGSHGLDHILRVTALCERIGKEEGAEPDILIPAALLHDIARPREKTTGIPHEEAGAQMAEGFLASIGWDSRFIPAIAEAIRAHRFSTGPEPASREAKILSDADKLDALGATGIARTFIRAGEHGGSIGEGVMHFHDKLLKLPDLMYTASGRRIARERHALMVSFLRSLGEETGAGE